MHCGKATLQAFSPEEKAEHGPEQELGRAHERHRSI
jgi:hypothetical protein